MITKILNWINSHKFLVIALLLLFAVGIVALYNYNSARTYRKADTAITTQNKKVDASMAVVEGISNDIQKERVKEGAYIERKKSESAEKIAVATDDDVSDIWNSIIGNGTNQKN